MCQNTTRHHEPVVNKTGAVCPWLILLRAMKEKVIGRRVVEALWGSNRNKELKEETSLERSWAARVLGRRRPLEPCSEAWQSSMRSLGWPEPPWGGRGQGARGPGEEPGRRDGEDTGAPRKRQQRTGWGHVALRLLPLPGPVDCRGGTTAVLPATAPGAQGQEPRAGRRMDSARPVLPRASLTASSRWPAEAGRTALPFTKVEPEDPRGAVRRPGSYRWGESEPWRGPGLYDSKGQALILNILGLANYNPRTKSGPRLVL